MDTWRENYPYQERLSRDTYDVEKYALQVELLKFQSHQVATGDRHVLVFEGRDAAGKGGTIKRFMEHLNPRFSPGGRAQPSRATGSTASGTSSGTSRTCRPPARTSTSSRHPTRCW